MRVNGNDDLFPFADFVDAKRILRETIEAKEPYMLLTGESGSGKTSLLRQVGEPSPDEELAELESELLIRINALGIGPQGFGGRTTALAVHVEQYPSHIASLPVAVNLQCHSARHKEAVL